MHRPTSKTSPFPFINHPLPIPPPLIAQLYFSLALKSIFIEHHTFSRYDRFSTLPYYLAYIGVRTLRYLLFEISLLSHTPGQSLIMQRRRTVSGSLIPSHHPLPPLPPTSSSLPNPLPPRSPSPSYPVSCNTIRLTLHTHLRTSSTPIHPYLLHPLATSSTPRNLFKTGKLERCGSTMNIRL